MHFTTNTLKRAHLSFLSVARPATQLVGLTPARFDLLYCLRTAAASIAGMPPRQVDLAHALGVAEMTVSKMVRSLEALRLVTRRPAPDDRRALVVELTAKGLACIDRAIRIFLDLGTAQSWLDDCFGGVEKHAQRALYELYSAAKKLVLHFGDWSQSIYSVIPPHPDVEYDSQGHIYVDGEYVGDEPV